MTSVQISTATDTNSSVWVDYTSDTAYVGNDNGILYKITPVFGGGAPAVVSDANWPVTVWTSGASKVLTDPIVDTSSGRIFMGDANGYLYAISLTNPAHAAAARVTIGWVGHGAGTGIVDPPIVVNDSANPAVNQVFSFTGCSNVTPLWIWVQPAGPSAVDPELIVEAPRVYVACCAIPKWGPAGR